MAELRISWSKTVRHCLLIFIPKVVSSCAYNSVHCDSEENHLDHFKNPLESLDLFWASQNNQIYVQVEASLVANFTYLSKELRGHSYARFTHKCLLMVLQKHSTHLQSKMVSYLCCWRLFFKMYCNFVLIACELKLPIGWLGIHMSVIIT